MTNPDNVGGLVWYVCTSCMLMVQLPSDTPTLGRCQCSPKGWSLRRAKLPKGYELCRAAPAGGAPESLVKWERDYDDTHLAPYCREDVKRLLADWRASIAAPAGGDDLYRQACDSVEEWKARALEAEADIARIHAQINAENGPTFMGEPVVSAPAGSGELEELVKEMRETARNPFASSSILTVFIRDWADKLEAVLLRNLSPVGSGEVQWPPRAMRGDDYVMLDDGRETLPLMSGCNGCRADEAGTWNRCIDECQKAVAKASGAGPDAFRLARWMEIHFRGNFPTPEFREIHAALLRKLQQGAESTPPCQWPNCPCDQPSKGCGPND